MKQSSLDSFFNSSNSNTNNNNSKPSTPLSANKRKFQDISKSDEVHVIESYSESTTEGFSSDSDDSKKNQSSTSSNKNNKPRTIITPVDLFYQRENSNTLLRKWYLIESVLKEPIQTVSDLQDCIDTITMQTHSSIRKQNWYTWMRAKYTNQYDYLQELCMSIWNSQQYEKFFTKTLPQMQAMALQLPNLFSEKLIFILHQHSQEKMEFSEEQICCLLCHCFFCTFLDIPVNRNLLGHFHCYELFHKKGRRSNKFSNSSNTNNSTSETYKIEKLKCIINYFEIYFSEEQMNQRKNAPTKRLISFERCNNSNLFSPQKSTTEIQSLWKESNAKVCNVQIIPKGNMEDTLLDSSNQSVSHIDFANKRIGGGVLSNGCVQEEICFLLFPECLVSRLITEELLDHETLVIKNVKRYSVYSGYSSTFKFEGPYIATSQDELVEFIAIDAYDFNRMSSSIQVQFTPKYIFRELLKIHAGFSNSSHPTICTGHLGCGAFGGDRFLKAILQLIVASYCNKSLLYFAFGDETFEKEFTQFYSLLQVLEVTVKELINGILSYGTNNTVGKPLLQYMAEYLCQ